MAKRKKDKIEGLMINSDHPCYVARSIVIDSSGTPWVIDPEKGTVSLAKVELPAAKQSAVK